MFKWIITFSSLIDKATAFAIAAFSCILLLFLLGDGLDYNIYLFGLSLIVLLILHIYKHDYTFGFQTPSVLSKKTIDYVAIAFAAVTFISNYSGSPIQPLTAITSTATLFFVPGWVLMRVLEDNKTNHRKAAILILSFTISVCICGPVFIFASLYPLFLSPSMLSAVYLAISTIPALKGISARRSKNYRKSTEVYRSQYRVFDILLILWLLIFFSFTILLLYPEMARVPTLDIVNRFSESKSLLLAPDIYTGIYPWYHFLLATMIQLSASPMVIIQSIIAFLSFILILSFYVMARSYLGNIDSRAPAFATILFSVFAGFGWRYYVEIMPNLNDTSRFTQNLNLIFQATYFDIGYGEGAWIWLWFRPVTIGLIILFMLFYILKNQELTRNKYIILCSLLLVALTQIHFSEFVVFAVCLLMATIFIPRVKLRLKETSLSVSIALVVYVILIYSYPKIFESDYVLYFGQRFSPLLAIALGSISIISIILSYYTKRPFSKIKINLKYPHTILITLSVLLVYLILLFHWFLSLDIFAFSDLGTILAVPWHFYPMLLGLTGIFAIVSIPIFIRKYKAHPVFIYVIIFILMICFGRAITFISSEFSLTGYFERRIVFHVFTAASMLAPISVFAVVRFIGRQRTKSGVLREPNVLAVAFVSFLVLVGTLSTFLSVEYQANFVKEHALPDSRIEAVQNAINSDPYSSLLTVSRQSTTIAQFSSPGYLVGYWSNQIWPSKSPELPLNILTVLNSSYIYMQGNDHKILSSKYSTGYLGEHLLKVAPLVYQNESEMVFGLPKMSPISSSSDMVLVLPDYGHIGKASYYAYEILSLAGYNYTSAVLSDISSISKAKVIVAPSESIASKIVQYQKDHNLKLQKLLVLNLDGYGALSHLFTNFNTSGLSNVDEGFEDKSNQLEEWIPTSLGQGEIGKPEVLDDYVDNPLSGRKASKINVEGGNGSIWQISKVMPTIPQNLSELDFVQVDWYGRGDGKWYVLQFTSDQDKSIRYRFQDSSGGWTRIILPLNVPDGRSSSFGVSFHKFTEQGASLSNIVKIDFRPEVRNKNQDGNFYLDGFFFGKILESSGIIPKSSSDVTGNNNNNDQKIMHLSNSVKLLPYFSRPGVDETATYNNSSVPFILQGKNQDFDIFYINIYPIIQQLSSSDFNSGTMFASLGHLLDFFLDKAGLRYYQFSNRSSSSLVAGDVAAFDKAIFKGDIRLQSSSAIIDTIGKSSVEINVDGRKSTIGNVSRLIPLDVSNVTIQGSEGGILDKGYGFYSSLTMNQSSILAVGEPAEILVEFENDDNQANNTDIVAGKEIQVSLRNSSLLLRQPEVIANGTADFRNFYAYGELHNKIPALGQQFMIEGKTSFKVDYSDEYTVANSADFNGKFLTGQIAYPLNELSSLANIFSLPYARHVIITVILFAVIAVYLLDKKGLIHIDADRTRVNPS